MLLGGGVRLGGERFDRELGVGRLGLVRDGMRWDSYFVQMKCCFMRRCCSADARPSQYVSESVIVWYE